MNNRISNNDTGEEVIGLPFGVFFVDVNGLKVVNDTKGHIAGDELLKDVSKTLVEIFRGHEIYRVGGDEFLVITPETSAEDFGKLEADLRSKAEREGHSHYAVGSCHSSEVSDIRTAMQTADGRMYANKKDYYGRHPEYAWDRKKSRER
jgi:diguanylate cyclase (GGDEF)-like protein